MTQMVSAERAAALRNKCLNLTKTCQLGSGSTSERTLQSRQLMSPVGGTKRTSIRRWSMFEIVVKVVKPHEARSEFNFSRAASASASFWVPSEASVAPSTPHVS